MQDAELPEAEKHAYAVMQKMPEPPTVEQLKPRFAECRD